MRFDPFLPRPEAQYLPQNTMRLLPIILATSAVLSGCSDSPKGRWEVIAPVKVYAADDDVAPVVFVLQPGDSCALSEDWSYDKAFRFKRVSCSRGDGWITIDKDFKQISDTP